MNSKGHLLISLAKSIIRFAGSIITFATGDCMILAISFMIAETLGIAEELVDKR